MLSYLYVAILSLFLLAAVCATTPLIEKNNGFDSDGTFYGAMAGEGQFGQAQRFRAPWCWRILTPFLASTMPFSTITNFKVLAFVSNWLCLVILYGLLQKLDFSMRSSIAGMLFYAGVFWTVKFSFYSPAYIDYQTQLFFMAILLLMVCRKYWWIIPVMIFGVLQKESTLMLAIVVYAHFAKDHGWFSRKTMMYLLGLVVLPLLAVFVVRAMITPSNSYTSLVSIHHMMVLMRAEFWPRFALSMFSGLGLLFLIILYRIRTSVTFFSENLHWFFLIVCGGLMLFGGVDKSRLFLYMLPAIIICAVQIVDDLGREQSDKRVLVWILATLLLHFYMGNYLTPIGSFSDYLSRMVPIHARGSSYVSTLVNRVIFSMIWLTATYLLFRRTPLHRRS